MNQILFDCERTKHPHTGLFYFCLRLGAALIRQADPAREKLPFMFRGSTADSSAPSKIT